MATDSAAGSAPSPGPAATQAIRAHRGARLGRGRRRQTRRILASRGCLRFDCLVAGLIGRPVRNQAGDEIGRLDDIVARWSDGQTYPPASGLVVRIGRRLAFVDASAVDRLERAQVLLRNARLDLRDFTRRDGEVMLAHDVLDHQLVDVDGVQVIRAADLYLAEVIGRIRLVGVGRQHLHALPSAGPAALAAAAHPRSRHRLGRDRALRRKLARRVRGAVAHDARGAAPPAPR